MQEEPRAGHRLYETQSGSVEVELERVAGLEDGLPLWVSMPPEDAMSRPLVQVRGRSGLPPAVEGWLTEALRQVVARP